MVDAQLMHNTCKQRTMVRLLVGLYRLGAGECLPYSENSRSRDRYCVLVTVWRSAVPMRVRAAVSLRESGCANAGAHRATNKNQGAGSST